jgi:hypothetical protein
MMGTDMVPETSVIFNQLTRLSDREDFINFSRHESFAPYTAGNVVALSSYAVPAGRNQRFGET